MDFTWDFKSVTKGILTACAVVSMCIAMVACIDAAQQHKDAQAQARELAGTLAKQKDKREAARAKARRQTEGEGVDLELPHLPGAPLETAMLTPLEAKLLRAYKDQQPDGVSGGTFSCVGGLKTALKEVQQAVLPLTLAK
jgi:hypothetical protein